jgi:signal transduction histidine kinase
MIGLNTELFFTLVAASVTAFLGFVVYQHARQSVSSKILIAHSFVGVAWALLNYISIMSEGDYALFWIRLVLFFAVPHVFLFLFFVKNFPAQNLKIPKTQLAYLLAWMGVLMILTLTPFVFEGVKVAHGSTFPVPGILIPVFGISLVTVFAWTVYLVIRKYFQSDEKIRAQWLTIGTGLLVAYTLLILLVFLRVILREDTTFVSYSPLFILPIFIGAAYAVTRHQLFSIKVIATEVFTFLTSLMLILIAESPLALALSISISAAIALFGFMLIKSVLKEVEQREQLQELTGRLKATNDQLTELSRFKTQLLSIASHQIKSPLAAIKGYAGILIEGLYGPMPDPAKETLQKMSRSTDDLINLVNTLLDLRKVEEGKMEYAFAKVDISKIVRETFDDLKPLALNKNLAFECTVPPGEVFVSADAQKFKQVVQNLIDNAIKYTPTGSVKVSLKVSGGFAEFAVADTGLGIGPNLIGHLFDEFVRDDRVKKEIRGTGLGLYIARKIIEAHGGRIWASSPGEGKGSEFAIRVKMIRPDEVVKIVMAKV